MTVIRLILLVAVLGGLTLLLAQNWSPAIPLVFLGWQTKPLSLAIWMLFGTAAGGFTSLLISSLLRLLPNRYVTQPRQTTSYTPSDSPRADQRSRPNETYQTTPPASTPRPPDEFENTADDDWDLDKNVNDDWDFEERFEQRESQATDSRSSYTKIQDDRDYEDFQQPSYSPQKRDFKNPNVEKTESVYDADYRVIIPPPNQSATSNDDTDDTDDDDDWGLFDDDFDDDDKRSPRQ
ncbi:LapA family protein [Rivularia sp. UHCC 0363]|uniref:LapA family protein n=1 Tax=Rivularia sp. UHCC 0363 TaxID=3110244 RepID=UPI002B1FEE95|nr:LapA family protein [Rivularia sp. UHCC 0363]MEA5596388.1 LapA family protein [Rivularia sp. UHCC 0363]